MILPRVIVLLSELFICLAIEHVMEGQIYLFNFQINKAFMTIKVVPTFTINLMNKENLFTFATIPPKI